VAQAPEVPQLDLPPEAWVQDRLNLAVTGIRMPPPLFAYMPPVVVPPVVVPPVVAPPVAPPEAAPPIYVPPLRPRKTDRN
ncbi:MAG: hypothetical protein Q8K18_15935, partial [Burkholderiales bacterium]|nr:hypothetical protein [Burkholderiales bacterium]